MVWGWRHNGWGVVSGGCVSVVGMPVLVHFQMATAEEKPAGNARDGWKAVIQGAA